MKSKDLTILKEKTCNCAYFIKRFDEGIFKSVAWGCEVHGYFERPGKVLVNGRPEDYVKGYLAALTAVEEKLRGLVMSEIDLAMFRHKSNNWDVDEREKYAKERQEAILEALKSLRTGA